MNEESKLSKLILKGAYAVIIVLIIAVIGLLILKYEVEGEQNMPFKLSNILVLSNAEGYQEKESEEYKWDTQVFQINDIYLNIEKNKNYKETEIIKSIEIKNMKIDKAPEIGEFTFYRAASNEKNLFNYVEEYEINEKVEYIGDVKSDLSNLKISNQGGTIILRAVNKTGKEYKSNEKEFEHSGKFLNKVDVLSEDIKSTISFDIVINLESEISFKANIKLDLPVGDIITHGYASTEITENIVFKREQ